MHRQGFTLLELSIVMAIIGLIAGGVAVGRNLVKSSELRALTQQIETIQIGVRAFKTQYKAVPGDMRNATQFWGIAAGNGSNATCYAMASIGKETCNGNGDGILQDGGMTPSIPEVYRFWQHLSNAGLLEGSFTGIAGTGGVYHHIAGENTLAAAVEPAMFAARYFNSEPAGSTWWFPQGGGNYIQLGRTVANFFPEGPFLTNADAESIDRKLDDGLPGTGIVMAPRNSYYSACASSNDPGTALYQVARRSSRDCWLVINLSIR